MANIAVHDRFGLERRWVNRRWKPTVIPSPVIEVEDREDDEVAPVEEALPREHSTTCHGRGRARR